MNQLQTTLYRLWESACRDEPQRNSCRVENGYFVFEVQGNQDRWAEMCQAAGVPEHAEQITTDDSLTCTWPSVADQIFGADGLLSQHMFEYEVRWPQLYMARLVQRSIEMRCPAAIEAGTGTGKSFAYAAVCMAMDKTMVVSTSNKALQMQLYKKDLPFLCELFPGKKVALAVGKTNYACQKKAEDGMAGTITIEDPDLRAWYESTPSGNLEELETQIDQDTVNAIRVNSDDCDGKHCPFYASCFYYRAREDRAQADVIVCNHALLCLHQLYPAADILPETDVVVVDESHKLPDYARNTLGVQFTDGALKRTVQESGLEPAVDAWLETPYSIVKEADERASQVGIAEHYELGDKLPMELDEYAESIWPMGAYPSTALERREARKANRIRNMADNVRAMAGHVERHVRWLEPDRERSRLTLIHRPFDVSAFIAELAGVEVSGKTVQIDPARCTRCGRELTADTVAVLDGKPYGPDCIRKVDVFGDADQWALNDWLTQANHQTEQPATVTRRSTVFCSATLATPDMSAFLRECGVPDALQMVAPSPFDYASNALLYVPSSKAVPPNDRAFADFMINEMQNLVLASKGGAFLLFTSYANMRRAVDGLRQTFEYRQWPVLVQGELPKLELSKRFLAHGNAVLFATKSFFEGVSIEGDALRLVCIDKMPFGAPTPLSTAMEADLQRYAKEELGLNGRDAEFYPFTALRLPKMIVELKQGSGRLIRTQRDWGVMAILDSRIQSARYGRETVLPSLPPAPVARSVEDVETFFADRLKPNANRRYVEMMAGKV